MRMNGKLFFFTNYVFYQWKGPIKDKCLRAESVIILSKFREGVDINQT